ncbi:hypothetical protein OHC50_18815 [Paenarthrobacter ilicis]|uniref:hypothetical protein n=1 Tax=Paenarthrobacter ilicis TaxID=43665 RepID=UPI00300BDA03
MSSRSEELASYVKLAPEGLAILAGMLDESIKESVQMRDARNRRKNGNVLHGLIREGVILAAKDTDRLGAAGIGLRARNSDGIEVRIRDADLVLKLTHRPHNARPADAFLRNLKEDQDVLFPAPMGHLRLFYSVADGGLGRLTLSRTLSEPSDYFRDCQILDEVAIEPIVDLTSKVAAAEATRNDADDLSDLIQAKHSDITTYEEETSNAETGGEASGVG